MTGSARLSYWKRSHAGTLQDSLHADKQKENTRKPSPARQTKRLGTRWEPQAAAHGSLKAAGQGPPRGRQAHQRKHGAKKSSEAALSTSRGRGLGSARRTELFRAP